MTDAPERIWAFLPDIFDNMSVWQDQPSPAGVAVEYTRADHALSLVAEAYDVAAQHHDRHARGYKHSPADKAAHEEHARCIRAMTDADALAAREARDKRVRAEALREAAAGIKEHTDTARKRMRMAYAAPVWSAIISHVDAEHDRILAILAETESRSE